MAVLAKAPYPVRMLMSFGTNLLVSQPDTETARKALSALEFHVHADFFVNATARYADIILPVATSWEREGLRTGFDGSLALRAAATGCHELVAHRGARAAAKTPGRASDRADGGQHVGRRGGLGAEVGELDRDRCGIDIFCRAHHLDVGDRHDVGHHDLVGGLIDDREIVRQRGVEVLEGVEGLGGPRHDHPRLLLQRRLRDDQRHRKEDDDVDEEADSPCRGGLHQAAQSRSRRSGGRCNRERRIIGSRVGRHRFHPV
jgi:hypothetical protein